MKAVLKLVLTYFTGTRLLTAITTLGAIGVVAGGAMFHYLPPLVASQGGPSRFSLAAETLFMLTPIAGVIGVTFGASLLPTLFTRLAASHYLYVLPYGRIKILASAFVTLTLVALVAAGTTTVYYMRTPMQLDVVFERAFIVSLLTCNLLYVVLWLTGRSSSAIGALIGSIVMIATLVLPLRFIALPSGSLALPSALLALLWGVLAVVFLWPPRRTGAFAKIRQALVSRVGGAAYFGGEEVDFLIGTSRPWRLALGQVIPVLMGSYFLSSFESMAPSAPSPWLFFMTILSILAGGIASTAATRSRRLWLRAHCTRAELFRRVENTLWRHNSFALGVLLILLVVLGSHAYLPADILIFGMGLLLLGIALSTYLGMMITAPIDWFDAALAVAAMLLLMLVAAYASKPATPPAVVLVLELGVAALTWTFRSIARRRWAHLDWMRCRADSDVRAAA